MPSGLANRNQSPVAHRGTVTGFEDFQKVSQEKGIGPAPANVSCVNALEEIESDELMIHLPENVGQGQQHSDRGAKPQPRVLLISPGGSQHDTASYAENEKAQRVSSEHAESDGRADGRPPAGIIG